MAEVCKFPGVERTDLAVGAQPHPGVIDLLEQMLARAKAGTVQAVAIATVENNDWTGDCFHAGNDKTHLLMAAITYLQVQFATGVNELSRDPVDKPFI